MVNHLKAIDGQIKSVAERGDAALLEPVPSELGAELVQAISNVSQLTPRIAAALEKFGQAPARAAGRVEAPPQHRDDEALAAVGRILLEELAGVTDKLDLYVRSADPSIGDLIDLLPQLEQIRATFSVVGLPEHEASVIREMEEIKGLQSTGEAPGEEVLLNMAKAFLEIESALRTIVGDTEEGEAAFGNLGEAEATVIRETRNGLAQCKDAVIEYVSGDFDKSKIEGLAETLKALRGGLTIINQHRSADVLLACAAYVERELLQADEAPELSRMDDLADALTSVDYYLERYLESAKDPYLQMVEVAEDAVTKLGYPPDRTPEPYAGSELVAADIEASEEAEDFEAGAVEAARPNEAESPVEVGQDKGLEPGTAGIEPAAAESAETELQEIEGEESPAIGDLVDDEITEIFAEEAYEVLRSINESFPRWKANLADTEALTEVRRAFHTLKGSGRMVGATALGELAWAVENMLNRVIDKTIEAGPDVLGVVSDVAARIPEGIEKFRTDSASTFDIDDLIAHAEALTASAVEAEDEMSFEEIDLDEALFEDAVEEVELEEDPFEEKIEEVELDEALFEDAVEEVELDEDVFESPSGEVELDEALLEEPVEEVEDLDEFVLEDLEQPSEGDSAELEEWLVEEVEEAPAEMSLEEVEVPVAASDTGSRLDEIFLEEADEQMETVREYIGSPATVSPDLIAALHTLKGSAGTARVKSVERVAAALEKLASRLYSIGGDSLDELNGLVTRAAALIDGILLDFPGSRDDFAGVDEFCAASEATIAAAGDGAGRPGFDFTRILLLSSPGVVLESWDEEEIADLADELREVIQQAESVGLPALGDLAQSLLSVYERLPSRPDAAVVGALADGHEHLVSMFDQLAAGQEIVAVPEVAGSLRNLEVARPAAGSAAEAPQVVPSAATQDLPPDEIDEDILPVFLEEAEELVEAIDQSILDWSGNPASLEPLDNLLRQLHTLKGGARLAGIASLGEYTHDFETFLAGVRQNPVPFNEEFFSRVNEQQDEVNRRVGIYKKLAVGEASEQELASMRTTRVESVAPTAEVAEAAQPSPAPGSPIRCSPMNTRRSARPMWA